MLSGEVEGRLRALLADAGVDVDHPSAGDVQTTWDAIRALAAEPVEDADPREKDGDGLLAQWDHGGRRSGRGLERDLTRQFSLGDSHGDYTGMTQLSCTFLFGPGDDLSGVGSSNLWSFGMSMDDFFAQVADLPGFRQVRERPRDPLRLEIDSFDV